MKAGTKRQRRGLRYPLTVAGLLLATGVALLTGSHYWQTSARQTNAAAESRLAQLEAHDRQFRETERLTADAQAAWTHYQDEGLSAKIDRVSWMEALHALRTAPGIAVTDFEFSPEMPTDAQRGSTATPLVSLIPLRIRAVVAHEERFIELLAALRKIGQVRLRTCSLSIADENHSTDGGDIQPLSLDVECQLVLIFMRSD